MSQASPSMNISDFLIRALVTMIQVLRAILATIEGIYAQALGFVYNLLWPMVQPFYLFVAKLIQPIGNVLYPVFSWFFRNLSALTQGIGMVYHQFTIIVTPVCQWLHAQFLQFLNDSKLLKILPQILRDLLSYIYEHFTIVIWVLSDVVKHIINAVVSRLLLWSLDPMMFLNDIASFSFAFLQEAFILPFGGMYYAFRYEDVAKVYWPVFFADMAFQIVTALTLYATDNLFGFDDSKFTKETVGEAFAAFTYVSMLHSRSACVDVIAATLAAAK